MMAVFPQTY